MNTITVSHKGQREVNQDYVLTERINEDCYLYLIVDGMGGLEHGGVASKIVAENILTYLSIVKNPDVFDIQKSVNKANLAIRQATKKNGLKMGATVGGVIINRDKAVCFWVGDVKIFRYQKNNLLFESKSHTLMGELVNNGSITDIETAKRYKHVVTRAVCGDLDKSRVDIYDFGSLNNDDLVVICSDGVHDILDGLQIQKIVNASEDIETAIARTEQRLINEAKDNFSFIFLHEIK